MQGQRPDQLPRYTPPRRRADTGNLGVLVVFFIALGLIAFLGVVWFILVVIF